MIGRGLRFMQGFVRIEVRGSSIERFLNICMRGDIELHQMQRIDLDTMRAMLPIADFRRLCGLMGRSGCRVHIIERCGAPFIMHRLRRRYVLWGGMALAAALVWVLTTRVWVVDIVAPAGISRTQVRHILTENGVYAGAPIREIEPDAVRGSVKAGIENASYVTFSRFGSSVTVQLYAERRGPETTDESIRTGVAASHDGIIKKMVVRGGHPLKQVGDAVLQGDLLVSAMVPPSREDGLPHLTHASASVTAATEREKTLCRPLTRRVKTYTGRGKTQFALVFGQRRINLYFGSGITAGVCDKIISAKRLSLGRGTVLPVTLIRQTYRYYRTEDVPVQPEQLRQEMEAQAKDRIRAEMSGGQIDHCDAEFCEKDGAAYLHLRAQCTEEIGMEMIDETPLPEPEEEKPEEE